MVAPPSRIYLGRGFSYISCVPDLLICGFPEFLISNRSSCSKNVSSCSKNGEGVILEPQLLF